MHQLERAFLEDDYLSSTIHGLNERVLENPLKLGLLLDLNPYWEFAHKLDRAGINPTAWRYYAWPGLYSPFLKLDSTSEPADLSRRYVSVEDLTSQIFDGSRKKWTPYLLRLYAKAADHEALHGDARTELVESARQTPIPTVVETHATGRLLAMIGEGIHQTPNNPGTLGGFVEDPAVGQEFAMTCGHVVAGNSPAFVDSNGKHVGAVVDYVAPPQHPRGARCSMNCPTATELDVALLDVTGSSPKNVAKGVDTLVPKGTAVTMHGANGVETYEVGPWVVDLEIGGVCYQKLIQFEAPASGSIVHHALHAALTRVPAGGDSGAWLLNSSDEWVGMVVAADTRHGYAIAGSALIAWTGTRRSRNLVLL